MRSFRSYLKLAVATALSAGLLGAAAAQIAPRPAAPKPAPAPLRTELPELPPLDDLQATRERPLFAQSRRPPSVEEKPPEPEPEKVVASDEAPADLIGIVVGPQRTYAILRDHDNKEVQHLQKGEKIEDWSLDEIAPRYIVLRRGASKMHVDLFDQKEADASHTNPAANAGINESMRPRRPVPPRRRVVNQPRSTQPQQRRPRAPPQRRARRGEE